MSLSSTALQTHAHTTIWTDIDNVFPVLHNWLLQKKRFVLVTLVGIDGGSPRPLGAQMAISETGESFGYISGGCLKSEIVSRAQEALNSSGNSLIRYGLGSPYIDITLPCGSGLDLYFDIELSDQIIRDAFSLTMKRIPFSLQTDLSNGKSALLRDSNIPTEKNNSQFNREYAPRTKLFIFGTDPAVTTLARLGLDTDMDVIIYTPSTDIIESLDQKIFDTRELKSQRQTIPSEFDRWSAAVLYFHDHEWELPIISKLLKTDCFYIGAQGSMKTHAIRTEKLQQAGFKQAEINRITGPIGLIPQTKSPAELAVSTLADIITQSKQGSKDIF